MKAGTRVFALLGDPVAHSLSPVIHNAALRALKLDAVYVALRCSALDFPGLMLGIARAGGGGNVTIPHKEKGGRSVERPSAAVMQTGACNTYWLEGGRVCGDNTDLPGFVRAVTTSFADIAGARVLVLGGGGGARAVVAGLARLGVDSVHVVARTIARGQALAAVLSESGTRIQAGEVVPEGNFDLVINATPLGLRDGDPLPLPIERLGPATRVFDLVYRTDGTAWVRAARAAGLQAEDGKEMLLQQAAASFALWWQQDAPVDVMRRALGSDPQERPV